MQTPTGPFECREWCNWRCDNMKTSLLIVSAVASLLVGCSKSDSPTLQQVAGPDSGAVALTPEVQREIIQRGRVLAGETFSLLSSNLQSALASGGVTNALPYCSLAASPLTASVGDKHVVKLRRVAQKARNPKDKADPAESAILEHYRNELSKSNALSPVVTNLQDGILSFFAPIVLTNALCLKCHGQPGKDIAAEHLEIIRRLYPLDEAVGFQLGELRGAWRIDFPAATLSRPKPGAR
jgi:hypothetical protein